MKTNNKPDISEAVFTFDVENGMSKIDLATKWGISTASVKEIAKTLDLTIKRSVAPKYTLVRDIPYEDQYTAKAFATALNN